MNWYPFGSFVALQGANDMPKAIQQGFACQRNGVVYRWGFDGATGKVSATVRVDGIRVR